MIVNPDECLENDGMETIWHYADVTDPYDGCELSYEPLESDESGPAFQITDTQGLACWVRVTALPHTEMYRLLTASFTSGMYLADTDPSGVGYIHYSERKTDKQDSEQSGW